MQLKTKFFHELTTRELYEIVRARTTVFLLEQNIICQDFDGVDYDSLHCFLEEDGKVKAYLRAYRVSDERVKIGRVLSIPHGVGLGTTVMQGAVAAIRKRLPCAAVILHAQTHAKGFYEKLGFQAISSVFLEEGIPHVEMALEFDGETE